jgi:hypothetical protein
MWKCIINFSFEYGRREFWNDLGIHMQNLRKLLIPVSVANIMAKIGIGYVPKRSPERHRYMIILDQILLAYFPVYKILFLRWLQKSQCSLRIGK